jgi:hypothetical protein
MGTEQWEVVEVVNDNILAEMLRGFLEAQGITAIISKEGAGHALGLTIGMLGESQIMVPSSSKELALQLLEDYRKGTFEADEAGEEEVDATPPDDPEADTSNP